MAVKSPSQPDLPKLPGLAKIPEHSIPLMQAMSGGEPIIRDGYIFFKGPDWLMAIGYPILTDTNSDFETTANNIADEFNLTDIYAIAPVPPGHFLERVTEADRFYVLPANAAIPKRLQNPVNKAASLLKISQGTTFTRDHRALWRDFLSRKQAEITPRVAELFARTPQAIANSQNLIFLNAYDQNNNLSACLLLDLNPANFVSYILGAHSRLHYTPHAMDALFAAMLKLAQKENKRFVHLGLGVNPGILRFKQKWGAVPSWPYNFFSWRHENSTSAANDIDFGKTLCEIILQTPTGQSARQILASESTIKPFAMLWKVRKGDKVSWLAGTAHFFLHSFESSFQKLFANVDNVIFEGPLDPAFMTRVNEAGMKRPSQLPSMLSLLNRREVEALQETIYGKGGFWAPTVYNQMPRKIDIPHLLATGWPWYVFFTLWTTFLERQGWKQSVDLEAWNIAKSMHKNLIGMESLEEQLESLQSLPAERAARFFRAAKTWRKRASQNLKAYLAGDLENMMGSSAEFPTRTEHIVGRRDQRFRERMRPWLEKGRTVVFVGSAHLVNLRHMLREDGFEVRQMPFGILPKIQMRWREMTRPDEQIKW